ncbi:ATP/GTP-binding protein, partial [Streptomyces sp. Vc17.3-30]|nr:ATP/GTP-binding protein [Streptomyces sp. Vc17.3-30]
RPGTLITHAAYLHARTGGRMGSLSHLIREAALVSLLAGTEKITKKLLDQLELDTAAEQRARAPHRHRPPSPRRPCPTASAST